MSFTPFQFTGAPPPLPAPPPRQLPPKICCSICSFKRALNLPSTLQLNYKAGRPACTGRARYLLEVGNSDVVLKTRKLIKIGKKTFLLTLRHPSRDNTSRAHTQK